MINKIRDVAVFTLILFFMLISSCRSGNKRPDIEGYQEARWGMSREEIKNLTKLPLTNELSNCLFYSDTIEEDNVTRMYIFTKDDKLFGITIVYELSEESENLYGQKFIEVYNRLTVKYGDADNYKEDELNKEGRVASWEFKNTEIRLQLLLKKPFNKLALSVLYLEKNYAKKYYESQSLNKY